MYAWRFSSICNSAVEYANKRLQKFLLVINTIKYIQMKAFAAATSLAAYAAASV